MNKIINELLNTNARVIIPDFGAFIIKQKNPRLIVFNEFLRYNDGLLIDYIAVSEGVDKSKAKEKVTKFVEEISQILSRGDEVFIDGLGKLVKDSSGKLTFIDENAASDDIQQKGKKPAAKKDVKAAVPPKPKPEQKKEEKAEPKKEEKIEQEEKEKAEPKKEQTIESKSVEEEPVEITFEKEDTKPTPPKEEKKPKEEKISVAPVKSAESKVESGRTGQTIVPSGKKPDNKSARKSNSMQIVGWIILIVIVNGAIVAWFLFNDQITGIFKRDKFKETQMATPIETDQENTAEGQDYKPDEATETPAENMVPVDTKQNIKAPAKAPVSQPVLHDRKEYYIVAGCFREERNADQLVIELKKKGFQAEKFGKIGNLYAVSFSSFTDKSTALEELKKIRNTEQKEAWIAYF